MGIRRVATLVCIAVPLVGSAWLLWRWLRSQPRHGRWLGLVGILPFLAVPAHWWFYPSDSVVAHAWFAAFQVLVFRFVVGVSVKFGRTPAFISAPEKYGGLAATGLAGLAAEIFPIGWFEHSAVFDDVAAGFVFEPPVWWWTISGFSHVLWFLLTVGLLPSSIALRRGWRIGHVGVALVVTFFAWVKWLQYEDGPEMWGPHTPGVGTIATVVVLSAAFWLIAAYRLLTGLRVAWHTRRSRSGLYPQ
jgi:hypothetical protein